MDLSSGQDFHNPYLNHLVIENILQYVNRITDLKNLRLLCHQWKDFVTPKLIQTSVVNINSEKQMQRFIQLFHSLELPLHKNFHLKVLQSLETLEATSFLKFILQSAEELHLSKCVMRPQEILEILGSGLNLKTLSFNEIVIDEDTKSGETDGVNIDSASPSTVARLEVSTCDEDDSFPWDDVFKGLPQLEVLHAQLQSTEQVTSLLESMLNQPLRLEEFSSFLIDFDTQQLNLLNCLEFPLKVLDLGISSSVSTKCIEEFLRSPSLRNIENLKLFHETDSEINHLVLPLLPNMKSLELMGDPVSSNILFSINKYCGKLKHLNLSQIVDLKDISKLSFQHKSLISFSIEEGFLSKAILAKLGFLFPNVEKVCLFLNDKNIGALFKEYGCLEEIIVLGTELTDLGIIGVSPSGRSRIGDCKKLRKFSLYPQPQNRITDMSIHHGLVHVAELTSVELPETAVTNEGLKSLIRAKPNLVKMSAKIAISPRTGEHSLRSTKYQIL